MFDSVLSESILKRAIQSKRLRVKIHDIRDYALDNHHKVDHRPFGGGPGMVMQCQPVIDALEDVKKTCPKAKTVIMGPKGALLNHKICRRYAGYEDIIVLCGHYEGMDERIRHWAVDELSIGDYILTGGEIPAMVLIDSVIRFIPGVLGDSTSNSDESFANGLLEYPHYTRPSVYKDRKVPDVLLSGNHDMISRWRSKESILQTIKRRPDLIKHVSQLDIQ